MTSSILRAPILSPPLRPPKLSPPLLVDSSPLVSDRKVKPDIPQQSSIRRDREPGEWGSRMRARGRDGESSNRLRMEDSRSPAPSWRRTRNREPDMESEHAGFVGEEEQEMEELMFPQPSRRRKRDREPETESEHAGGVGEGEQEVEEHMQTAPNPIDEGRRAHAGGVGEGEQEVAVDDHAVEADQAPETVKADDELVRVYANLLSLIPLMKSFHRLMLAANRNMDNNYGIEFLLLDSAGEMVDLLYAGSLSIWGHAVAEQQRKKNDQQRVLKFVTDHQPQVVCLGGALAIEG